MNEPSVLAALARRYAAGQIYTRTGPGIIIAVNPFGPMPQLYDAATMDRYRLEGSDAEEGGPAAAQRAPHIFAVASRAYWQMVQEGRGQALLVGGPWGVPWRVCLGVPLQRGARPAGARHTARDARRLAAC
jgi:myosin-5